MLWEIYYISKNSYIYMCARRFLFWWRLYMYLYTSQGWEPWVQMYLHVYTPKTVGTSCNTCVFASLVMLNDRSIMYHFLSGACSIYVTGNFKLSWLKFIGFIHEIKCIYFVQRFYEITVLKYLYVCVLIFFNRYKRICF